VLETVLTHIKNWFLVPGGVYESTFAIEDNTLALPFLQEGQYYRICGSVFNDGLHKYGESDLRDETFTGTVWALAIPKAVVELAAEIEAWQEKNGEAAQSPFASESFGGYSYTKATDANTGAPVTWEAAFRSQLNPWRKARETGPVKVRQDRYEQWRGIV
jgi:hypothetical protein